MRIDELLATSDEPVFSFEFFPPKTPEGEQNLFTALAELQRLEPAFVSVTYGAMGSTRTKTIEIVQRIQREFGLEAMAHFAVEPFAAWFALGEVPTSSDRPRLAQAYILRTADAGLVVLHLSSLEKFWQALVDAVDRVLTPTPTA